MHMPRFFTRCYHQAGAGGGKRRGRGRREGADATRHEELEAAGPVPEGGEGAEGAQTSRNTQVHTTSKRCSVHEWLQMKAERRVEIAVRRVGRWVKARDLKQKRIVKR